MRRLLLAALLALAAPANAATIGGATLPDTYPLPGQTLLLNGIGLRTVTLFNVRVYAAALYVTERSNDPQRILKSPGSKVVLLQFLHAATKSDIEKQFREGERKNCGSGGCDPADAADFERLIAATPPLAVGDTFTYIFTPGRVRALVNNRQIADFANPDLAYHLLEGFIGAHPPSPELRQQLLGTP